MKRKSNSDLYLLLAFVQSFILLIGCQKNTFFSGAGDQSMEQTPYLQPTLKSLEPASNILFTHKVIDTNAPSQVWGKAVGDLNGDSIEDMVVCGNGSQGGLAIYESPGFDKTILDSEGGYRTDIEVVDMDNDGDNDIVALKGTEVIWLENPSWTIHSIATPGGMHDIEVGDLDGNGLVDVVVRNQSAFGSSLYLHFYHQTSPNQFSSLNVQTAVQGEGLKIADLDSDGHSDVIINSYWYRNSGNGVDFDEIQYSDTWTELDTVVEVADINGDGRLDIALSPAEKSGESYRISWFESPIQVSGLFTEHVIEDNVETVYHALQLGDLDGDGDVDVAVGEMEQGSNPDEIIVYSNLTGQGTSWSRNVIATGGAHNMKLFDADADGDLDILSANWQFSQVDLFVNESSSPEPLSLDAWDRIIVDSQAPQNAPQIYAEDLNGDGLKDIIVGPYWYQNPGQPDSSWSRRSIGSGFSLVAMPHDLDGDGDIDLIGIGSSGELVMAINSGGNFAVTGLGLYIAGDFLQGVDIGDVYGDGVTRLILSYHNFAPTEILSLPVDPVSQPWSLEVLSSFSNGEEVQLIDLDGDGDLDLHAGEQYLQNNQSSWAVIEIFDLTDSGANTDRLRIGDINGDGFADAIVGTELGQNLVWAENPGSLGSNPSAPWTEHIISQADLFMSLDVADIDKDGDLDIVVGEHQGTGKAYLYENIDNGSSFQVHMIDTGMSGLDHHDGMQLADLDNDGDLDVYSVGWTSGILVVYENRALDSGIVPVPTPVFSPNGGSYTDSVTVNISTATASDYIYYTTDGADPDSSSSLYSGPIVLTTSATIKAVASLSGQLGAIYSASFVVTTEPGGGGDPGPVPANSLAHFNFDNTGNSVLFDNSGNGNHGTIIGATYGQDGSRTYLDFDGNDHVDLGSLDFPGSEMTLAGWVNFDSFNVNDGRIISKSTSHSSNDIWWMLSSINSGSGHSFRFRLKTNGSTTTLIASGASIPLGQWVHVAAVYDGAAMRVYQNGVLVGSTSKSGSISQNSGVGVALGDNPGVHRKYFDGKIDTFSIVARALNASEINDHMNNVGSPTNIPPTVAILSPADGANYDLGSTATISVSAADSDGSVNQVDLLVDGTVVSSLTSGTPTYEFSFSPQTAGSYVVSARATDNSGATTDSGSIDVIFTDPTPPEPGSDLLAGYSFVDSGTGVLTDISGNSNHGQIFGATFGNDGVNPYLNFDGNDHVDLGTLDIPGDQMSISAKVYFNSFNVNDGRIISKSTSYYANDIWWMVSSIASGSTHRIRFRLKTNGNTTTLIAPTGNLQLNTWHHIAVTYDGAQMRIYLDGVEVASTGKTGTISQDPGVSAYIGDNPGIHRKHLDGRVSDLGIYTKALTPQEVLDLR